MPWILLLLQVDMRSFHRQLHPLSKNVAVDFQLEIEIDAAEVETGHERQITSIA